MAYALITQPVALDGSILGSTGSNQLASLTNAWNADYRNVDYLVSGKNIPCAFATNVNSNPKLVNGWVTMCASSKSFESMLILSYTDMNPSP